MKIICHFGAHKTATSHLQYNLKLNEQLLEKNGIRYFYFGNIPELGEPKRILRRNIHKKDFDPQKVMSILKKVIDREIHEYDCAIISHEGILGDIEHDVHRDIYPNAKLVIRAYEEILNGHEVIPVFASRNYDSFLRSTYKWKLKKSKTYYPLTLDAYLANKNLAPKRWTEIIRDLDEGFKGSVQFFPYEEYKDNWKQILFKLIQLTGKPIDYNQIKFEEQKKNVSGRQKTLNFYYTLHLLFGKIPEFKYKKGIYRRVRNHFQGLTETKLGSKLLLHYQKKEIPPLNNFDDYWREVQVLKSHYGILKK